MKSKREHTRAELIIEHDNGEHECILCGQYTRGSDITHADDCVFANNCVTGIRVDGISGGIVFRLGHNRWWWTSPASGRKYRIEKLPGRYSMFEELGTNPIHADKSMARLRLWVGLNQGVL